MEKRNPLRMGLANLLAAVLVITGTLALTSVFALGANAIENDKTTYDYKATATQAELSSMPGVYRVQVEVNKRTDPKNPETVGIPSIAKQNLEDHATKEMPGIIMGAAVNYEVRTGAIDFTPIGGAELLPPYSYFRWKYMEKKEKDPDGTERTIKTLTGFDGSYYIVRVDVSKIIEDAKKRAEAAGGSLEGKYLHVRQENNKALLVATGMTDSSYVWADTAQTNNKGGCKAAAYPLKDNAAAMLDTKGNDNKTPYLDVILLSSAKNVAGAESGKDTAPVSNVDLSFYVDDTLDYKPWLKALDPNNMPTFPYTIKNDKGEDVTFQAETDYNQALTTKFFDEAKATTENSANKYRLMGEDLEIDVGIDPNKDTADEGPEQDGRDWIDDNMDFWSMEKAIASKTYDNHTIIMICEVPVLNGMSISGTADRSVILDVNSFDIQIANNTKEGKAGLTIGDHAILRIKDGSNTAGAELAIGNNATMVIEKGGTMIIDETCTAEAEFDAASTVDPSTQPDKYLSGEITIQDGGQLQNWGVINIEGTEGKPLDPSQQDPVKRDKQSADILVEAGGILDNYGCISVKGTLHVMGMLNNYAKFTDIIHAYDPDKNRIDYHKGIQVTWKDDVTQEGVVPGELWIGKDIKGNINKDAVLNNTGDIVLCPGTLNVYGTFNNVENGEGTYEGHLYLCTVDEAIIPIVNPTDPTVVEKRVKLDPPRESVLNWRDGTLNNKDGLIDYGAKVTLLHNGVLGDLIPPDEEFKRAKEAIAKAETAVKEAQKAMDDVLAKENPTKEEMKTAYDAVKKAQDSLAAAKERLAAAETAKKNADLTYYEVEVTDLRDQVETLETQVSDLKKQVKEALVIDISNYEATLAKTSYTYTGKAITPAVKVAGLTAADYTVAYANNKAIGKATVTITGKASKNFKGKIVKTFQITKKNNTLKAKAKTAAISYKKLKKKAATLKVSKVIKITNKGKGKLTYAMAAGNKAAVKKSIKIAKKTGKVTVKKGLKRGTYKVKVKVKAAGNKTFKAGTKVVIVKIKVK